MEFDNKQNAIPAFCELCGERLMEKRENRVRWDTYTGERVITEVVWRSCPSGDSVLWTVKHGGWCRV